MQAISIPIYLLYVFILLPIWTFWALLGHYDYWMLRSLWFCYNDATFSDSGSVNQLQTCLLDQLQTCLLFGDNNKRVWHMTDQTLENKSVNSFNRYNLMKNLIDQCHSWWVRVGPGYEMFTSAAILMSYFGAERSGRGGGVVLILYMHM